MTVDADTDAFGPDQVAEAVSRLGMRAAPWDAAPRNESWWEAHGRRVLVVTSGLSLVAGFVLHIAVAGGGVVETLLAHTHGAHDVDRPVAVLLLAGIVAGLFPSGRKAVVSLVRLRPDMNALVLVSVVAALFLAEWAEAAALAFLHGLSGLIENWSAQRARNAIGSLLRLAPATAAVVHGDHEHRTPVDRVAQIHRRRLRSALLTGDNAATARSVGARVRMTDVRAELLPDGKAEAIDEIDRTARSHGVDSDFVGASRNAPGAACQNGRPTRT